MPRRRLTSAPSDAGGPSGTAATPTGIGASGGPEPLSFGSVLGDRYEIRSRLGRGGMGEVWHAFDLKLRVEVALKSLRPEYFESEKRRELLRGEVRSARAVVSPNVCRVFDLVVEAGHELVSMEYVDGQTLLDVLRERGPLTLREAGEIASQFLAGLEAVHAAGLVHRDFKPENVMLTRTGRVVVMDLGIAKSVSADGGTVSGTPAYMAPEQARGETLDARADIFAVGVVLAEMVSGDAVKERAARQSLWTGLREEPPQVPDSPWLPVIRKALSAAREDRYASAQALSRALEKVTQRAEGAEEKDPYPGLASFREEDAEHFFGRETEVETMLRKLGRPRLLGLVGPSGAGKTSFVQAGLIPALPEGWGYVLCHPGERPFAGLGRALAPQLSSDAEAVEQFFRFDEPDVAVSLVGRWRRRHSHALVIVDQFEELFTLNSPEVQSRFAELLGRLALEADVHVMVSMRDDFLAHCQSQPGLRPLLQELTVLIAPTGPALRRAIVQPALRCGYRFEDETLVDGMLGDVSDERAALPLLAFAAARLWERRDRDGGLLTRRAYAEIGGVGGALAQHAEATLERIGSERQGMVHELFRNLVTAQGTRAASDREELLSVFSDREAAERVLGELIDARLLTSYEVAGQEGKASRHRIEIVHESLLSAWPRLVRWQTQDADGAQFRDQLRQAARVWDERGRSSELLWSGTAYREFEVWRERYPGGLTETEDSFARAMAAHSGRRRRRRRLAVAAGFLILAGVAGLIEFFRQQAVDEARRAEASKLLALGKLEIDESPTAAVAYALKSLELADAPQARVFALEALQRGPITFTHDLGELAGEVEAAGVAFSPDGRWIATGDNEGHAVLWPQHGGEPILLGSLDDPRFPGAGIAFGPRGERLVHYVLRTPEALSVCVWSVRERRLLRELELPPKTGRLLRGERLFTFTTAGSEELVRWWPLEGGETRVIGRMRPPGPGWLDVDASGSWLAYDDGRGAARVRSLKDWSQPPRLLGRHDAELRFMRFHPAGDRVAVLDASGEIRFWSLAPSATEPLRVLRGESTAWRLEFSPDGGWLAVALEDKSFQLWDLEAPSDADPIRNEGRGRYAAFHPNGRWMVNTWGGGITLHSLARRHARVLRGHQGAVGGLVPAPDGSWLASTSIDGTARVWPLAPGGASRVVATHDQITANVSIDVDPGGGHLLLPGGREGVLLVPVDGGPPRPLAGAPSDRGFAIAAVALGPEGRLAAAARWEGPSAEKVMHVWDLATGEHRTLGPSPGAGDGYAGGVWDLEFARSGSLYSIGPGSITRWSVEDGTAEVLHRGSWEKFMRLAVSSDGRRLFWTNARNAGNEHTMTGELAVLDLETRQTRTLEIHGNRVFSLDLGPRDEIVTGDWDGLVRVGPASGATPHVFFGHGDPVSAVAVDPRGRWVASAGGVDTTIRVWPMPQGEPFHTLPYEELLVRLRTVTNLRAVEDDGSATGYKLEPGPFPGWQNVPTW